MSDLHTTKLRASVAQRMLRGLRHAAVTLSAMVIAACGTGDDAGMGGIPVANACSEGCGTALLTVTDAPGDFLSYTVDITSIELQKANGTKVQTLPVTTRIDFVQLVELNEVLSAGQIPAGEYVAATLNVDMSNASIVVDDGTGAGVAVTPVNAIGQALGQVALNVELDHRNRLQINRGRVARLAFDLNLAASNSVDLTAHTVTVNPFIVANITPPATRETRARGRLASVDVLGSAYTIDLRPFHERTQALGQLIVHTNAQTTFEINGEVFAGAAGLSQLAGLASQPMVIAFGTLGTADHIFTAKRVLAGSSIEDAQRDHLSGNVLARSGNTLTVGGVRLDRRDGRFGFERGRVVVTIGPQTRVTRAGQGSGSFSIADISVGQRIEVQGLISTDNAGLVSLDATAGRVRLDYTRVYGAVMANAGGMLTLSLHSIDGRSPAQFNFAGTGANSTLDANPASYEIATGSLNVAALPTGAYTRLFGFVTPFGTAPPDFRADTVLEFSGSRAELGITWNEGGSTAPFLAMSSAAITVNLAATSLRGGIEVGGRIVNLRDLATGLSLVPVAQGDLELAIGHHGSHRIENFSSLGDFTTQLGSALNGTTTVQRLVAQGQFDAPSGVLTLRQLLVVLSD